MPKKAEQAIRERKNVMTRAEAIRQAAAEARGRVTAAKPKAAAKPKQRTVTQPKVTGSQAVPSISGGTGARSRRLADIEAEIRRLQGK